MKARFLIYDKKAKVFTFVKNINYRNKNITCYALYEFPINQKLYSFTSSQITDAMRFASKYGEKVATFSYGELN